MRPRAGREERLVHLTRRGKGILVGSRQSSRVTVCAKGQAVPWMKRLQCDGSWLSHQIRYVANIISNIFCRTQSKIHYHIGFCLHDVEKHDVQINAVMWYESLEVQGSALISGLTCIKESCIFIKQSTFLLIFTFTISLISFLKKIYGEASHFSSP